MYALYYIVVGVFLHFLSGESECCHKYLCHKWIRIDIMWYSQGMQEADTELSLVSLVMEQLTIRLYKMIKPLICVLLSQKSSHTRHTLKYGENN